MDIKIFGVPVVVQWLTTPTRNHEVAGSIPALAQWVKDLALPCTVVWVVDTAQILPCFRPHGYSSEETINNSVGSSRRGAVVNESD